MLQLNLFDIKPPDEPVAAKVPATFAKGKLYRLDLSLVFPDPEQPRKYFDPQSLAELAASIVNHGVLQPILVRTNSNGTFFVVSGERRYQAAKSAGLVAIPAMITDGEPAEIAIIENLIRENLTAIEEAEAIERLRAIHDYGLSELSAVLGKAESTLSEILSLNRLPAEIKDDCRNSNRAIRSILTVIARQKSPEKMISLYQRYKENGLTYGEIRKKAVRPKLRKVSLTAEDVAVFCEKLETINASDLADGQKTAISRELTKLRGVAYQKLKLLKVDAGSFAEQADQ